MSYQFHYPVMIDEDGKVVETTLREACEFLTEKNYEEVNHKALSNLIIEKCESLGCAVIWARDPEVERILPSIIPGKEIIVSHRKMRKLTYSPIFAKN